MKGAAPLRFLVAPILGSTVLFVVALVLASWFPTITQRLRDSGPFNVGQILAVLSSAYRAVLHPEGRRDIREDFLHFVSPHLTQSGLAKWGLQVTLP